MVDTPLPPSRGDLRGRRPPNPAPSSADQAAQAILFVQKETRRDVAITPGLVLLWSGRRSDRQDRLRAAAGREVFNLEIDLPLGADIPQILVSKRVNGVIRICEV